MAYIEKYDKHTCIFCFSTLKNTDICFETADDTVEMEPDPVKLKYERRFDNTVDENDVRCLSRMPIKDYVEGDEEFDLDPDTGIPTTWHENRDGWRLRSTRRLCRFCHQPLPSTFGKRVNITVGLCGNSASGKTVYMLSLIRDMQKIRDMSVTPDPVFYSEMSTNYKAMYEAMYTTAGGYALPDVTKPNEMLSPLVLNCAYSDRGRVNEFSITIFDMAGEGMRSPSYMAKQAVYLENAAGVIYLKNPDYFPGMPREDEQLEEHSYLEALFDTITRRPAGSPKAHIALTMTKFDLVLNRYEGTPEFDKLHITDLCRDNPVSHHQGGFNITRAMQLNRRMHQLYGWENTLDQRIRSLYDRQKNGEASAKPPKKLGFFARLFGKKPKVEEDDNGGENIKQWVMLFAASPLGRNVQFLEDNRLGASPSGLLNVDPLLGLLYCSVVFPPKGAGMEDDDE